MPVFSKITTTLSAVLALSSTLVSAAPFLPQQPSFHRTLNNHRRTLGTRGVDIVSYHHPATYETYADGVPSILSRSPAPSHNITARASTGSGVSSDVQNAALTFLSEKTGIAKDNLKVRSGYTNDIGVTHVYLQQMLNGIPVDNSVANMSFDKDGKVVSFGSNIVKPTHISSPTPVLSQAAAIDIAVIVLSIPIYLEIPPSLTYIMQPDGSAVLTHVFQLRNADVSKWVEAYVDATNSKGTVVHVVDFVADAAYNVVEWSQQDPTWSGFNLLMDPQNNAPGASPNGWHKDNRQEEPYYETQGNNVLSYFLANVTLPAPVLGQKTVTTSKQSSPGLVFDYKWDPNIPPNAPQNLDVARVNAFYVTNTYHDMLYLYGFTEKSFNFQNDNYGKGGDGNDRIEMQVQAPGENNANFATPPDGQSGHCNMFLWTYTTPMRDGDLENDIITHELTHGLTNRLTGGGSANCLQTIEAGGMGEGWSDTVAFWSEQSSSNPMDFTLGGWVVNNPAGIRSVPYSINMNVDPLTYGSVASRSEVHAIGEVWATILIEAYWALVAELGFETDKYNSSSDKGNTVFLHLLVDALALQPCNPTFVTARDAWIQADSNRYGGSNYCTLWRAFAVRGLGFSAQAGVYENDFSIPPGC